MHLFGGDDEVKFRYAFRMSDLMNDFPGLRFPVRGLRRHAWTLPRSFPFPICWNRSSPKWKGRTCGAGGGRPPYFHD
jgi:hypothetical protein